MQAVEQEAAMYLGWYDPDRKKTPQRKLEEAADRYREKWGREPLIALVNAADAVDVPGLQVRVVGHVAPNTFFVGEDEESVEEREAA
jgi:hypothetical protein